MIWRHLGLAVLAAGLLLAAGGTAVRAVAPTSQDRTELCIAELRLTEDGQQLERFWREVQRDLGPAAAVLGDEATLLRRLTEAADPQAREAGHARLHALLGSRLDDATHAAIHSLTDQLLVCVHGG